jgi:hypothetical protein
MHGGYGHGCGCSTGCGSCDKCSSCEQKPKVQRKRICNATSDDAFDAVKFLSDLSYYDSCDCAVFQNCTNTTVIVPPTPVIPVPPLPPSGSSCVFTCEDVRTIQMQVFNLTTIINQQQDEIDMLISQYQYLSNKTTTGSSSCCDSIKSIDQDISDLFEAVNNCTTSGTAAALAEIRDNGLRFGDKWWLGHQGDYLFAIDIQDTSYYRFDPSVNRTL